MYTDSALRETIKEYNLLFLVPGQSGDQTDEVKLI